MLKASASLALPRSQSRYLSSQMRMSKLGKVKGLAQGTESTPFTVMQSCLLGQGWMARGLTRKVAIAAPVRKPASTSDQWLRYSATRTTPTRKAGHSRARQSEGLTRREPFTRNTSVTYICRSRMGQRRHGSSSSQTQADTAFRDRGCGQNPEKPQWDWRQRPGAPGNRARGTGVQGMESWTPSGPLQGWGCVWPEHQRAVDRVWGPGLWGTWAPGPGRMGKDACWLRVWPQSQRVESGLK